MYTNSELTMWETLPRERHSQMLDDEINAKYSSREWRIVTETNREVLPNFVDALKRPGWMEVRPFYQRRLRWDFERQSKLIESFIMNIPIPPLFVFEADLARYEVMDGQQRITAIREFFSNNLRLEGLEQWPELNGRTYSKLPSEIRKGIDRRSISYIVLLKESAETTEEQVLLRQMVFERLNTGGVELSQQEVRNCLFQGAFNDMLFRCSRSDDYRTAWKLPRFTSEEESNPPVSLLENPFYSKMTDVENVVRFFALRHVDQYRRGMQGFIDLYMLKARKFSESDIQMLEKLFLDVIGLARQIYDETTFCPWLTENNQWADRPHRAFADAVMVSLSRHLAHRDRLIQHSERIKVKTRELFESHPSGTFTGRGNTKEDVRQRIDKYETMIKAVLAE